MKKSQGIDLLAISIGDPAGIGPEIVAKALQDSRDAGDASYVIFADKPSIRANAISAEEISVDFQREELAKGKSYFVDVTSANEKCAFGKPTAESGKRSVAYLQASIDAILAGRADALATAPISKEAWKMAGFDYPGHTEYLQEKTNSPRTEMAFISPQLSVVLFTTHLSMLQCVERIKKNDLVSFLTFVESEFHHMSGTRPRIWVTGLNAHAGESGMFGREEIEEIIPAIEICEAEGLDIHGPFPADTMFHSMARKNYDLAIAMYHDQGLTPVKTIAFEEAVNFTLGLPFIRTSPAHGTAFDLAGKGKADPSGMKSAISTALKY